MSYLNKQQVLKLTSYPNINIDYNDIIEKLKKKQQFTKNLLKYYQHGDMDGWEINETMPHPMIFELGHITLFYDHHFIKNTNGDISHFIENPYTMFDSIQNKPEYRFQSNIINMTKQFEYYDHVIERIIEYISNKQDKITKYDIYLIHICLYHNVMHDEVLLFLQNQLERTSPIDIIPSSQFMINQTIKNNLIYIKGGSFFQGLHINDNNRLVVWDNERPKHQVYVNSFYCYEYPVTNSEYLSFVLNDGYKKREYWTDEGWKWVSKRKIWHPINWFRHNGKWYRKHFNRVFSLEATYPVNHINKYEAEAYASFIGGRLPSESEYEYIATNGSKTHYPWGNDNDVSSYCNVNYQNGDVCSVLDYQNGENQKGIKQLMGNCWYWTSTHFYPYDGYQIDPVYDNFSYPFFYHRYVVKGASWACGKELVYPQYRNAQEPEKQFHFTGIRVVKDEI